MMYVLEETFLKQSIDLFQEHTLRTPQCAVQRTYTQDRGTSIVTCADKASKVSMRMEIRFY